jgi:hydroxypyruvate isomerase
MSLRHTAADWCFYRGDLAPAAYYRRLRELGFAGVEMVADDRLAVARDAGLEIVTASGPGMGDGLNRASNHPQLLDEIRSRLAYARRERIGNVIVFSGVQRELGDEAGIEACVAGLHAVAGDAERTGVTLLFEPLCRFDHADQHASRAAYGIEVVRRVAHPRVRLLYDIYHLHRMGDDPAKDIPRHLELIGHLHLAGAPKRDFPGPAQQIAYAPIVAAARAAGYAGWWGHEFVPGHDALAELGRARELFDGYARGQPLSARAGR